MKKLIALMTALCMLFSCTIALADTASGRLKQRISTRTGPGTNYTEPGSFLSAGNYVTVHTKVWDSVNEIWWVQVEFTYRQDKIRAYTGSWRMNVNLANVPTERVLGTVKVINDADVFAGPGLEYMLWNETVYRNTWVTLLEVENGYGLIECWNNGENRYWRVWARMQDLSCASQYSIWDDTYPDYGSPNVEYVDNDYYYDDGGYHVEEPDFGDCRITVNYGNVRSGAGAEYRNLGTVYNGETYYIYDTERASNGVTWYKIWFNGAYGWISSGLTNHGKY